MPPVVGGATSFAGSASTANEKDLKIQKCCRRVARASAWQSRHSCGAELMLGSPQSDRKAAGHGSAVQEQRCAGVLREKTIAMAHVLFG
ncbi:hypothetical protein, partial [Stenotrophomonas sp. AR029]|uniref:hypothetical protein n=1 Tax=Stenotrophomonas sp. AR029 TaxID=3398601 RepID=UPI0039C5D448